MPSKILDLYSKILIEHFIAHNKQRFIILNLYIVLISFLVIAAYFSHKICHVYFGQIFALLILGIVMSLVTFVFWKLETRVRDLIEHTVNKIIKLENQISLDPDLQLFSTEKLETENKRKECLGCFYSYSKCFKFILILSVISYVLLLFFIYNYSDLNCSSTVSEKN